MPFWAIRYHCKIMERWFTLHQRLIEQLSLRRPCRTGCGPKSNLLFPRDPLNAKSTCLGLQTQPANNLAISSRLFRNNRRRQLDLIKHINKPYLNPQIIISITQIGNFTYPHPKAIQGFNNLPLLRRIEKSRYRLFALAQYTIYDFKIGKNYQKSSMRNPPSPRPHHILNRRTTKQANNLNPNRITSPHRPRKKSDHHHPPYYYCC